MFNIKKYIDSAPKIEDAELEFLGQKVKVRALRGSAWEKYVKTRGNPEYNSAATVLYFGLIDEETGGQYSMEDIEKLLERYTGEANALATKIIDMSAEIIDEELRRLAVTEKNSVSPATAGGTTSGAGISD